MDKKIYLSFLIQLLTSVIMFFVGNSYNGIEVAFGFPINFIKLYYQGKNPDYIFKLSEVLKGEYGINVNMLAFVASVCLIYFTIVILKRVYNKILLLYK